MTKEVECPYCKKMVGRPGYVNNVRHKHPGESFNPLPGKVATENPLDKLEGAIARLVERETTLAHTIQAMKTAQLELTAIGTLRAKLENLMEEYNSALDKSMTERA